MCNNAIQLSLGIKPSCISFIVPNHCSKPIMINKQSATLGQTTYIHFPHAFKIRIEEDNI